MTLATLVCKEKGFAIAQVAAIAVVNRNTQKALKTPHFFLKRKGF